MRNECTYIVTTRRSAITFEAPKNLLAASMYCTLPGHYEFQKCPTHNDKRNDEIFTVG